MDDVRQVQVIASCLAVTAAVIGVGWVITAVTGISFASVSYDPSSRGLALNPAALESTLTLLGAAIATGGLIVIAAALWERRPIRRRRPLGR